MKKLAMMAALTACVGMAQAQPFAAWTKYRDVTINTTSTGANVATNQANFPVLVRLTNASEATGANVLSEALAGGADIRFTDSTGTVALAHEIESWSATSAPTSVVPCGRSRTRRGRRSSCVRSTTIAMQRPQSARGHRHTFARL